MYQSWPEHSKALNPKPRLRGLLIGDGEEASVIVCDLVEGRHVAIEPLSAHKVERAGLRT